MVTHYGLSSFWVLVQVLVGPGLGLKPGTFLGCGTVLYMDLVLSLGPRPVPRATAPAGGQKWSLQQAIKTSFIPTL